MIKSTGIRITGNLARGLDIKAVQAKANSLVYVLKEEAWKLRDLDNVSGIDFNPKPGKVKIQDKEYSSRSANVEFHDRGGLKKYKCEGACGFEDARYDVLGNTHTIRENSDGTITYMTSVDRAGSQDTKYALVTEKAVLSEKGELLSYSKSSKETGISHRVDTRSPAEQAEALREYNIWRSPM